ncbi:MAG: acetyl-CoA carboxylase carboxyltransferase subunit alpha [Thermodesulfobacteriota bacterium]
MAYQYLDFEKPIFELEKEIEELKAYYPEGSKDINRLESKLNKLQKEILGRLTPWQITQLARHPQRPFTLDYINAIFNDFIELHGDRRFKDDPAIVGGIAALDDQSVVVIGHQKGKTTRDKIYRNFGMSHPEGFRKASRLMQMAERFGLPLITMIDTPGAFPGLGAEERGQSEAIAVSLQTMASLKVPIVVVIIGEGGSGGALALGVGDRVLMLEYAVYSVISPEGCAAILWKDRTKADLAADALKLTSKNLLGFKIIDEIVKEPPGGVHKDNETAYKNVKEAVRKNLESLKGQPIDSLVENRYKKFREMGRVRQLQQETDYRLSSGT